MFSKYILFRVLTWEVTYVSRQQLLPAYVTWGKIVHTGLPA